VASDASCRDAVRPVAQVGTNGQLWIVGDGS